MRLTVFNLAGKHYYRARTGDTLGDVLAQAMPGRRWQATLRYKF
jgi:outer membrane receptor protein involved in Fe transport